LKNSNWLRWGFKRRRSSKPVKPAKVRRLFELLERRDLLATIISEVNPNGSSAPIYGADWFEITNTGPTDLDITGWRMDDNSNSAALSVPLRGLSPMTIPAGKSAVFFEGTAAGTTDATIKANFSLAWFGSTTPPVDFLIGAYGGSGIGLSGTGDAVNLFNSASVSQASVTFGAATAGKSFDNAAGLNNTTISQVSVVGVNGAFVSANGAETGSPGTIVSAVPTISISAFDASAAEAGQDPGTFRITRTGSTASALTVNYSVATGAGQATSGDYTPTLTGTTTISTGQSFVDLTITPVDDAEIEASETVNLSLIDTVDYDLGGATSAAVTIQDGTSRVNLSVSSNTGTEVGATQVTVTATASRAVSGDQSVQLAVTGTGITAGDYALSSPTITILNGQTTGSVTFTVVNDGIIEGTETATLTISTPTAGIALGNTTSQNIAISDNVPTSIDLSLYVRIGRYDLPEPTRTTPPANSVLAQEVSAVTYNWDTDSLFVVGDGGTSVVQVTKTGQLIDSMTLAPGGSPQGTDFYDPEGLTYIGGGKFVMSEERDRQAVLFTYTAGGTLTRSNAQTVKLGTFVQNIGTEGITYDPQTGGYIALKETLPQGIFQTDIDFDAGTATNGSPTTENSVNLFDPALANLADLADVFALSNLPFLAGQADASHLLLLSQESGKIVNIDRSGTIYNSLTIITDPGNPLSVPAQQHEGLTMDRDGYLYVVSENGGGDFDHPQLWVYGRSLVPNEAPTALALNNQVNAIDENTSTTARIKVADVVITDDGIGTNNLTVIGPDASFFEVDSNGLYIKAGTTLDFETKSSYSITVNVDDPGLGVNPDASASFSLTVNNIINEDPAHPTLFISEVAPWSSGNSPVAVDWFEVTNTSATAVSISGWKFDDNSNSFVSGVTLNGITSIGPGESVIFLETANLASVGPTFLSTWFGANPPAGLRLGSYTGGGVGLGTGGDAVNLFNSSGVLQANVSFGASPASAPFATFNNAAALNNTVITTLSSPGVNGAFVAVNDANEIGSPGSVGKLFISEVAPWSSGSPVGADWFEVTNTTAFAVDISGWRMDDNSGSFAASVALNGITSIASGESVIFLETANPAGVSATFRNTWFGTTPPTGLQIGSYSGAGVGLSTSTDAVNLYSSTGALQISLAFGVSPASPLATFDNAAGLNGTTATQLSSVGVNGAFIAANDVNQIGSPAVVFNSPPVANADSVTTAEDSNGVTISVLANDTDADRDPLSLVSFTTPSHGTVTTGTSGSLVYTPGANYNGTDTFSYTITDGHGRIGSASVAVTITAVNDGPVNLMPPSTLSTSVALVADINGGHANPGSFVNVNGILYFHAVDNVNGYALWITDGTSGGTTLVADTFPSVGINIPNSLTNVNGTVYFRTSDGASGYELWKSDGTSSGTTLVADIRPGASSANPNALTNVNGTLFFRANNGVHGAELWKSDGTSSGTTLVADIFPGATSSNLTSFANVNGTLYFQANDGARGAELWKSDGTSSGTTLVANIAPGANSAYPRSLTNVNGTLYFGAQGVDGYELWKSDGTSNGTLLVADILPGPFGSHPDALANVNGTLYFQADDGVHGFELWKSDGTSSGTRLVADIVPGSNSGVPSGFTGVNGAFYFLADDGIHGAELWISDGTSSGTRLAVDIYPGATGSSPGFLTSVNDTLYFSADDSVHGNELFSASTAMVPRSLSVNEDAALSVTGISITDVDAGTGNIRVTLSVTNGTLSLSTNASGGVAGGAISGNGGPSVTIVGSLSAINATLADASGLTYLGSPNFSGNDVLTVLTNDLGNTGAGGTLTDTDTIAITVLAVNDGPTNNVPASRTVNEDIAQAITGLFISDVDSGSAPIIVSLSVSNGTLNFRTNAAGGVTSGAISGNGSASITITAPRSEINATLASVGGLLYLGTTNFNGSDALTVITNDLGNAGAGGALTDTDTVVVVVTEVNDAPSGVNDALSAIAEDSGNRTISFASLLGNDSTGPANESSQSLTISTVGSAVGGTVAIVGSDVIFTPALNYNGPASFVYTLRDNGTTNGVNDFKTSTATASFTITEVNDAPNAVTDTVPYYIGPGTRTISQASLLANDNPGPANESSQTLTFGTVGAALPSGTTVSISGGNVLYTPPVGYSGPASFTYTVTDNGTTNGSPVPLTSTGTARLFFLFPGVAVPAVDLNGPGANFGNAVTYTEGTAGVPIATGTSTLTDADSTYLLSITATLLAAPDGASESLSAVTTGTSITSSYNPTTRVLTLLGPDTAVNFQQVLRTIAYQNTSVAPTTTARTVRVVTSDGGNVSSARDATVSLVAVNNGPTITGNSTPLTFTENDAPIVIDSTITPIELDSVAFIGGSNQIALQGATISVTPWFAGQDKLFYTPINGVGATINQATGVIRMTVTTTLVNYQAALRSIQYQNTSDNPTAGARVVTFSVTDGTSSTSTTRTINVVAVNDAPTADLNGPVATANNYSTTYRTSVGTIPIAYTTSTLTDPDNATMTSLTVTITNVQNVGSEVLTYVLPGGISASAPSNSASTIVFTGVVAPATYQTLLRSIQYRNLAVTPTLGAPRAITVVTNDGSATLTSTTTVTLVSPLQAASDPQRLASDKLSAAQLTPIVQAAIERWSATGLSREQIAKLQNTSYVVADIGLARWLGQAASGNVVTIDDNAAGFGWFVDSTPHDDREFTQIVSSSQRTAPGVTRMDLLTVVMHEMGHILGLPDVDDDAATGLMTDTIAAGTRRVGTQADLQALVWYVDQQSKSSSPAPLRDADAARADVFARWS
jgi:ELWxxDGT repeat protein